MDAKEQARQEYPAWRESDFDSFPQLFMLIAQEVTDRLVINQTDGEVRAMVEAVEAAANFKLASACESFVNHATIEAAWIGVKVGMAMGKVLQQYGALALGRFDGLVIDVIKQAFLVDYQPEATFEYGDKVRTDDR